MSDNTRTQKTLGLPTGNLSEEKIEELYRIRKAIMEGARKTVDPKGTGFDAFMFTDDEDIFGTDDDYREDWREWMENISWVISVASQRVGLAVLSAGFAVAGATMIGNERSASIGQFTLGAAAVVTIGFAVTALTGSKRRS